MDPNPSAQNPQGTPKKVLVVEDDFYIRDLYKTAVSSEGFETITAADGEEALSKITSEHPDLILLDIMLPKLDGMSILKSVKADPETKDITILVTTNMEDPAKQQEAMSLGAAGYLLKVQYSPDQIVDKVKHYI